MSERKTASDISKSTSAQQSQEGGAAGDSWKSDNKIDGTTTPGENAAANADDTKVLQEGVGDGS